MTSSDSFRVRPTHLERAVYKKLDVRLDPSVPPQSEGFSVRRGHVMTLELGTTYYCCDNQREQAELNAQRLIRMHLYKDVHRYVAAIRQAIFSGEDSTALVLLDEFCDKLEV